MTRASMNTAHRAGEGSARDAAAVVKSAVVGAWKATASGVSVAVSIAQIARMTAALNEMSDEQLDQIGVKRANIYSHAENLILSGKHRA